MGTMDTVDINTPADDYLMVDNGTLYLNTYPLYL